MHKRKDVLTTGQVAQICNVAPRTVTKWFDSGQLKGYRIPGSRDRRIPTSELIRFMKAHDIPTDTLEVGKIRVLIIDSDWKGAEDIGNALEAKGAYEVRTAQSSFDAGIVAQKLIPHVMLINLMAPEIDAKQVSKYVRSTEDLSHTKIVAIAANLRETEAEALHEQGFDAVITKPDETAEVIRAIQDVTAILY
jgi:excisionase family DNA binding protein